MIHLVNRENAARSMAASENLLQRRPSLLNGVIHFVRKHLISHRAERLNIIRLTGDDVPLECMQAKKRPL